MSKQWIIGIDPGHGNPDEANKGPTGYIEAHGVLDISLACEAELNHHGVNTILTRRDNSYNINNLPDNLTKRVAILHNAKADMSVSIHTNAPGSQADWDKTRGVMVIHSYAPVGGIGRALALKIVDEFIALGIPKWSGDGTWTRRNSSGSDYYGMIRLPNVPAIIVECEYHTHPVAEQLLKDPAWRKKFGVAIAHGILKQIGVAIKREEGGDLDRAIALLDEARSILTQI